jgi:hypothetical protein
MLKRCLLSVGTYPVRRVCRVQKKKTAIVFVLFNSLPPSAFSFGFPSQLERLPSITPPLAVRHSLDTQANTLNRPRFLRRRLVFTGTDGVGFLDSAE